MTVAVVGAGPAGLMAAQVLSRAGLQVEVFDAMPSAGRKFLLAGKGGLNLTHSEPFEPFASRYGARRPQIEPLLRQFDARALREWAQGLGIATFVGTSGRVFPTDMKAAPLLRAWLHGCGRGRAFSMRHRFIGWTQQGAAGFESLQGELCSSPRPPSWPWSASYAPGLRRRVPLLEQRGVSIAPWRRQLRFRRTCAGGANIRQPVRRAAVQVRRHSLPAVSPAGRVRRHGQGAEGSLIYAVSAQLRDEIAARGSATFALDLLPARSAEQVLAEVAHPRGSRSLSSHLKSRLSLDGIKMALLHELLPKPDLHDAACLPARSRRCRSRWLLPGPSTKRSALPRRASKRWTTMLREVPGVFAP